METKETNIASNISVPKIYGKICDIMSEIGVIGKEKSSPNLKYKYRGVDDVMNALQPLLREHRVFTVPEVMDEKREERQTNNGGNLIYTVLKIKYTFYADDGSCVETIVMGEGMDSGDKSGNKAMSIGFKYACFQIFCIATEETKPEGQPDSMIDPDGEFHEITPKQNLPSSVSSPNGRITEEEVKYIKNTLVTMEGAEDLKRIALDEAYKAYGVKVIAALHETDVQGFVEYIKDYIRTNSSGDKAQKAG